MGLLGFGRVKKLEDLKMDDLRKERTRQEVHQDQMVMKIRRAQDEYDALLDVASEPELRDAEIDVAAYRMSVATSRKQKAEADLQRTITRMTVMDSAIDIIQQKEELKKRGVWGRINDMAEDDLEDQLEELAIRRKESDITLDKIIDMFAADIQDVKVKRSAGFRASREAILKAREARKTSE